MAMKFDEISDADFEMFLSNTKFGAEEFKHTAKRTMIMVAGRSDHETGEFKAACECVASDNMRCAQVWESIAQYLKDQRRALKRAK